MMGKVRVICTRGTHRYSNDARFARNEPRHSSARPESSLHVCLAKTCVDVVTSPRPWHRSTRLNRLLLRADVSPPRPTGIAFGKILANIRWSGKKSTHLVIQQGQWRGFTEDFRFDACRKPQKLTSYDYTPSMQLFPYITRVDEKVANAALPDRCPISASSTQTIWEDIAAAGLYNKFHDDLDAHQSRGSCNLKNGTRSSRRRFVLEYTIDHQYGVVARVHESHTNAPDHPAMVRVFAVLLLSQPQKLDWDLTMTIVCVPREPPKYDVVIEDARGTQTRSRTFDLRVRDPSQSELIGKGTRLWRSNISRGSGHFRGS